LGDGYDGPVDTDPFHWIPYNDNQYGIRFSSDNEDNGAVANRGYRARTSECFGYDSSDGEWHVWQDAPTATLDSDGNTSSRKSSCPTWRGTAREVTEIL